MRKIMVALVAFTVPAILVGINFLEGQTMGEEQAMKLLKDFIALAPNEVPGFDTKGGTTVRVDLRSYGYPWDGVSIALYQLLSRKGRGVPGRDPTEISIEVYLLPNRNIAYQMAIDLTTSQYAPIGQPGMPEGSWTGLPIGEKSWATAPKPRNENERVGSFTSSLVVWDDKLAFLVEVGYPPLDPKAKNLIFFPIEQEDLELGELAARLILAKASWVLLDFNDLPQLRLVVNGASLQAKEYQGTFFVPVTATLNRLGVNVERRSGVFAFSWRGRQVTLPVGSRLVLVGRWQVQGVRGIGEKRLAAAEGTVNLSHPVMFDGKEYWVDGKGLAKALGMKVQRSGRTVTFVP